MNNFYFKISPYQFKLFNNEIILIIIISLLIIFSSILIKYYKKKDIVFIIFNIILFSVFLILYNSFVQIYNLESSSIIFNFALTIDFYSNSVKLLLCLWTLIVLIGSFRFLLNSKTSSIEYPLLIVLGLFFLMVLVSSYNFMVLYLSIEGLSLLLYVLAAFPFNKGSLESSIKYFILSAIASGILVFGILIIYGHTGSFDFFYIKWILNHIELSNKGIQYGLFCIIYGFLFKLGLFPCHMWSLDVYTGSWLPSTTFFMTSVKTGIVCLFVRLLLYIFYPLMFIWKSVLILVCIGSLLVGCIGALTQKRLKRIFIYSSINQVGFSLLGLVTGNLQGFTSSFFFIFIYILSSIGLFSILLNTESYIKGQNLVLLSDLTNFGLFNKRYSFIICIILFSMAGIPPLAGFFSKYYIFKSLVDSSMYMLAIYSILISIVNSFVYIKILKIMFFDKNVNRNENDYFVYCIYKNLYTNIKKKNNVKNLNLCVFYENLITSLLYIISLLLIYIPCDIVVVLNYIKFFTMNCYLILSI